MNWGVNPQAPTPGNSNPGKDVFARTLWWWTCNDGNTRSKRCADCELAATQLTVTDQHCMTTHVTGQSVVSDVDHWTDRQNDHSSLTTWLHRSTEVAREMNDALDDRGNRHKPPSPVKSPSGHKLLGQKPTPREKPSSWHTEGRNAVVPTTSNDKHNKSEMSCRRNWASNKKIKCIQSPKANAAKCKPCSISNIYTVLHKELRMQWPPILFFLV